MFFSTYAVVPPLILAKDGWDSKKEAAKPAKRKAPRVSKAKQAEQVTLRKELEEDIA